MSRAPTLMAATTSLLGSAHSALACPNCYGASDSTVLSTYYLSTAVLTLLPFTIAGGIFAIVSYLRRQAAEVEAGATVSDASTPHASA